MKKVELNLYKKLKRERNKLIWDKSMNYLVANVPREAFDRIVPDFILEMNPAIASNIWLYYKYPEIHTPEMDKIVDRIKDISIDIENMHPKEDRKKKARENIGYSHTLTTFRLIKDGWEDIPKYWIEEGLKNVKENKLLQDTSIKDKEWPSMFEFFITFENYLAGKPAKKEYFTDMLKKMKDLIADIEEVEALVKKETNPKVLQILNKLSKSR